MKLRGVYVCVWGEE